MISLRSSLTKCLFPLRHVSCWAIWSEFFGLINLMSPLTYEILLITFRYSFLLCNEFFWGLLVPILYSSVKVNGIRTIYLSGSNNKFGSKFHVGSLVLQETLEEHRRVHQVKHCEYNNKDEENCPNTLNDKNEEASHETF